MTSVIREGMSGFDNAGVTGIRHHPLRRRDRSVRFFRSDGWQRCQ
ncbi:hypothetical protein QUF72_20660 [Desulfobacterales bacterium HSG2]|nr:hypothetical protein [Desulfobacterales bacterium HSG2]